MTGFTYKSYSFVDAAWLIAAVVLAGLVLTATILMAVNFPRIHAAQAAVLMCLNGLSETNHLALEAVMIELRKLDARVKELEDAHG
jgi:hypothetical protein